MNGVYRKEGTPEHSAGKEFIIVIVVVFSSLSFTLGFFVGKNNKDKKADPVVQAAAVQPAEVSVQQNAVIPLTTTARLEGSSGSETPTDRPLERKALVPPSASESATGDGAAADSPKAAVKETGKTPSKQNTAKAEVITIVEKPPKSEQHPTLYTVQLGALKNVAEAKSLKAKVSKRGYKTYITVIRGKSGEKIYKVRAGEFEEKKDAETLSIKLKKNEGLNAFVTVKNE